MRMPAECWDEAARSLSAAAWRHWTTKKVEKPSPGNIEAMVKSGSSLFESVEVRKDGSEVPVEVSAKVVSREGAGVIHAFVRDLTERKKALEDQRKLQEQLQEAQKMEAVGRLAGGIAHDFNNLLTVINGYSEMGLEQVASGEPLHADLTEIKRATRRAATLTAQLLAFSRRQILQPRIVDLGTLVAGMMEMIERLLGEDIQVRAPRAPDSWGIRADPGRIEQVVMNLAVNSRDAMPQGGVLSIETTNLSISEDFPREHPEVPRGEYVCLSVIDTGIGMDQATMERIFEPFFTTKEKGKGTGLGLATVYGIVKQSNGFISCDSKPGTGTAFRMFFPRAAEGLEEAAQIHERPTVSLRGAETILLVEDDEAVRRISLSILESGGYTVMAAAGGVEALRKLSGSSRIPDLLVTDVVMPGMDGKEVARRSNRDSPARGFSLCPAMRKAWSFTTGCWKKESSSSKSPLTAQTSFEKCGSFWTGRGREGPRRRALRLRLHVADHPVDAELVRQVAVVPEELVLHGVGGLPAGGELGIEGVRFLLAAALDCHRELASLCDAPGSQIVGSHENDISILQDRMHDMALGLRRHLRGHR